MSNVAIIQPPRQTPMWTTVSFFFVAGLATLAVLRTVHPVFEVDKQYQIQGLGASDETWSAYIAQQRLVDTKNTALLVGVLGGTLGMALAFIRPATGRLAWRLIIGTVAGALVGFMAGSVAYYLQLYYAGQGHLTLLQSVLVQTLLFGSLGLGLGTLGGSFAFNRSLARERVVSGLMAGLIVGVVYSLGVSIVFPTADMDAVIPSTPSTQTLWSLLAAGMFGWLIPRSNGTQQPDVSPVRVE